MKNMGEQKGQNIDMSKFKEIEKSIKKVVKDMDVTRLEQDQKVDTVRQQVISKADIGELRGIEEKVMEKLTEIVDALVKKFADKKDTRQNFKILERQIKNLFELLLQQKKDEAEEKEDD